MGLRLLNPSRGSTYPDRSAMADTTELPCLAVLPFHLTKDEGKAYLVRGFVEDVITELLRFSTLGVRYILSGSFRHQAGPRPAPAAPKQAW